MSARTSLCCQCLTCTYVFKFNDWNSSGTIKVHCYEPEKHSDELGPHEGLHIEGLGRIFCFRRLTFDLGARGVNGSIYKHSNSHQTQNVANWITMNSRMIYQLCRSTLLSHACLAFKICLQSVLKPN